MTARTSKPKSGVKTARQFLYWAAIGTAVIFCIVNIIPYVISVRFLLNEAISVIGGSFTARFLTRISPLLCGVFGIILWGLIQALEVYPILLKHDRKLMRTIVQHAETADQFVTNEDDDPALATLKDWFNNFPLLTIRQANRGALFAYAVDTIICIAVYPPVAGGFKDLLFVLLTGQWGLINWGSVVMIVATLFVVELAVKFVLHLDMTAYYFKASRA